MHRHTAKILLGLSAIFALCMFALIGFWSIDRNSVAREDSAVPSLASQVVYLPEGPWNTISPWKGFTYKGTAIDPNCIGSVTYGGQVDDSASTTQSLSECSRAATSTELDDDGKGTVSADNPSDPEDIDGHTGYTMYTVLASNGSHFILSIDYNGGGTGQFSEIVFVHLDGDSIDIEHQIAAGDRCNGGLAENEKVTGETLTYSINLTPADMVLNSASTSLEAYKDLEASATSCVATEDHHVDLHTGTDTLASWTLSGPYADPLDGTESKDLIDQEGWTDSYTYGSCFNHFYNSYVDKGVTTLSPSEIRTFGSGFMAACLER